jgi:hypothetical protein
VKKVSPLTFSPLPNRGAIEFFEGLNFLIRPPHKKALPEAGLNLARVDSRDGITRPACCLPLLERESSSQSTNNDVVIIAILIWVGNPNDARSHSNVIRELELVEAFKVPRSIVAEVPQIARSLKFIQVRLTTYHKAQQVAFFP